MNTTELNKSEVRLLIKVLPYKTLRTLLTVELTPNLRRLVLKEYDWRDYGGKHYESIFTRFFHSYYLVEKFGYDLRRAYVSAEICSGQISRDKAINELARPPADPEMIKSDIEYVKKKLKFSDADFDEILAKKNLTHDSYGNNSKLWSSLKKYVQWFRKVITEI